MPVNPSNRANPQPRKDFYDDINDLKRRVQLLETAPRSLGLNAGGYSGGFNDDTGEFVFVSVGLPLNSISPPGTVGMPIVEVVIGPSGKCILWYGGSLQLTYTSATIDTTNQAQLSLGASGSNTIIAGDGHFAAANFFGMDHSIGAGTPISVSATVGRAAVLKDLTPGTTVFYMVGTCAGISGLTAAVNQPYLVVLPV